MEPKICPYCKNVVRESDKYCFNCGHQLTIPTEISISKQIGVYLLSFFLPPFGLIPGIKYLKNPNKNVRLVGIIAVILTVLSLVINIWVFWGIMSYYSNMLREINNFNLYR